MEPSNRPPGSTPTPRETAQAMVDDVLTIKELWRRTSWIKVAVIALGVAVALGAFGGFVLWHTASVTSQNGTRLRAVQVAQQQEEAAQKQAFCITQGLFVGLDTPQGRAAAPDKAVFDQQFSAIRLAYVKAGCTPDLPPAPPGSNQTP